MTKIKMKTDKGVITLQLFDDEAPMTVASFLYLAKQGFYDGIIFHRVIDDFMIQGGDPLGRGTGGPKSKGINSFPFEGKQINYPFEDEFQSGKKFDKPGILAMANAGANTNGSQFFITHVPTPWLNNKHTIFGEVIDDSDQAVVNAIEKGDKINKIEIID
ncbi:MAG: peptidylprolyl isomerase [Candidatus Lokiarchaeota archaeon]|nr:peptidylprolyl isomerase [Candidatus Lokiarchaeota archaeon]